jgi:hypothetical protein
MSGSSTRTASLQFRLFEAEVFLMLTQEGDSVTFPLMSTAECGTGNPEFVSASEGKFGVQDDLIPMSAFLGRFLGKTRP